MPGPKRTKQQQGTRQNARGRILQSAVSLVATAGVDALTYDRLADATGISKGGILYHFPSKHELLTNLVAESAVRFEELWDSFAAQDDVVPGRQARAYLNAYVSITRASSATSLNFALLAATASDPSVMKPYVEAYERWQERLADDGIDEATATVLRLVSDGLWATDLFHLPRLDDRLLDAIVERLRVMSSQPTPATPATPHRRPLRARP